MAFLKKCISSVTKCEECGNPGVFQVNGKAYCEKCSKESKKKK